MSFTHLHVHNHYSLLDGMGTNNQYIDKAKLLGMPALALTNHGTCGGFYSFYNKCTAAGVKPILGVEVYVVDDMTSKSKDQKQKNYHLVLLAKNANGVKNLHRLLTEANVSGFYYKPRIDLKCLQKYREDLIALSACTSGLISAPIWDTELGTKQERDTMITQRVSWFLDNFEDNFYFEVMPNEMDQQYKVNIGLIALSHKYKIPIVATNDCHYVEFDDYLAHDTLLMIQSKSTISEKKWTFDAKKLYLMTRDEMKIEFKANHRYINPKEADQYLDTSLDIMSRIDIKLDYSKYVLPKIEIPTEFKTKDNHSYMLSLVMPKFFEITKDMSAEDKKIYKDRLDHECKIIGEKGLAGYFIIVQDFIGWAHKNDIYTGPGRGSAAGSLISYLLGITEVDPIKFGLLFERFINPERLNMPDIDSDFEHERRDDVKQYIIDKYGAHNVASIGTYSTMNPNMCFRDVCRAHEIPYVTINALAKTFKLKDNNGNDASLEYNISVNDKLKKFANKFPEVIKIISRLQGQYRHCSMAAGGVLITDGNITDYMAMRRAKDVMITEWDKYDIDGAKLLKIDVLGIQTLSIIKNTLKLIGKDIKWLYNLPLDDTKTLDLFRKGETLAVFQYESEGMSNILKRFTSLTFEDLVAVNSLYRPGSMEFMDNYVDRKYGREQTMYAFPEAEKYLKSTYGLCLYQEQLMYIVHEAGGLTLGEADILRKAKEKITDDNKAKIQKLKDKIMKLKGESMKTTKLLAFIDGVGGYSFNRSHSVCYALLGYYTMYLKAHYPKEFSLCVLNNSMGDIDETRTYLLMAKKLGVIIDPVNINRSKDKYTITKEGHILKGLVSVKGIGDKAAIHVAKTQPFFNLEDFLKRIDKKTCNKKITTILAGIGAFDTIESYASIKLQLETILKVKPEDIHKRYFYELKHLGVFEKSNPLDLFKKMYAEDSLKRLEKIDSLQKYKEMATIAVIMDLEELTNYKNEKVSTIKVCDGRASDKVIVNAGQYDKWKDKLQPGNIIMFVAKKLKYRGKSIDPIMEASSIVKIFVNKEQILRYITNRG